MWEPVKRDSTRSRWEEKGGLPGARGEGRRRVESLYFWESRVSRPSSRSPRVAHGAVARNLLRALAVEASTSSQTPILRRPPARVQGSCGTERALTAEPLCLHDHLLHCRRLRQWHWSRLARGWWVDEANPSRWWGQKGPVAACSISGDWHNDGPSNHQRIISEGIVKGRQPCPFRADTEYKAHADSSTATIALVLPGRHGAAVNYTIVSRPSGSVPLPWTRHLPPTGLVVAVCLRQADRCPEHSKTPTG